METGADWNGARAPPVCCVVVSPLCCGACRSGVVCFQKRFLPCSPRQPPSTPRGLWRQAGHKGLGTGRRMHMLLVLMHALPLLASSDERLDQLARRAHRQIPSRLTPSDTRGEDVTRVSCVASHRVRVHVTSLVCCIARVVCRRRWHCRCRRIRAAPPIPLDSEPTERHVKKRRWHLRRREGGLSVRLLRSSYSALTCEIRFFRQLPLRRTPQTAAQSESGCRSADLTSHLFGICSLSYHAIPILFAAACHQR
jgi:hypothetical protein